MYKFSNIYSFRVSKKEYREKLDFCKLLINKKEVTDRLPVFMLLNGEKEYLLNGPGILTRFYLMCGRHITEVTRENSSEKFDALLADLSEDITRLTEKWYDLSGYKLKVQVVKYNSNQTHRNITLMMIKE